jgi:hypothetical protein
MAGNGKEKRQGLMNNFQRIGAKLPNYLARLVFDPKAKNYSAFCPKRSGPFQEAPVAPPGRSKLSYGRWFNFSERPQNPSTSEAHFTHLQVFLAALIFALSM